MRLRLIAVGNKMPAWVNAGFEEYAKRMPRTLRLELTEIKPALRPAAPPSARAVEHWKAEEAARIRAALTGKAAGKTGKAGICVALDERGELPTTAAFANRLERWQQDGRDVAFVIGGADGLDAGLREEADALLALSKMTLPHGLCRVLLAEQLYRAVSLLQNHPYHRE